MKKIVLISTLLGFILTINAQSGSVNAITGDTSFVEKFGYAPDETTNETTRIITHLEFVEKELRSAATNHLNKKQRRNRQKVLGLLHEYIANGVFPVNYDHPGERRPCFIDKNGNICAVGYLIEKTVGRSVAENINVHHKYDKVMDMNEDVIDDWANTYGLTIEECAMIQPTYGPPPADEITYAEIKPAYGISSAIVAGGNIAISAVSILKPGNTSPTLSYIGMATGAGQIILGITNIRKINTTYYMNGGEAVTSYKDQNNLSYVNIAVGTATIVSSTINLIMYKKNKDRRNAFNLYSYPNNSNSFTMGLAFTRKI